MKCFKVLGKLVYQIVYKSLVDNPSRQFDVDIFMQEMKTVMSEAFDDPAQLYAHLALVPKAVQTAAVFMEESELEQLSLSIMDSMRPLASFHKQFMDPVSGLKAVEDFFKVEEPVAEEKPNIEEAAQPQQETPSPFAVRRVTTARPADFMSTTGQTAIDTKETPASLNKPDPEKVLHAKVIQKVVALTNGKENDDWVYPGLGGPLKLKVIAFNRINDSDLTSSDSVKLENDIAKEAYQKSDVVMVITDRAGNTVRFDEDGNVSPDGRMLYFPMRKTRNAAGERFDPYAREGSTKMNNAQNAYELADNDPDNTIDREVKVNRYGALIEAQMDMVESAVAHVNQDRANNSVSAQITSGSEGFIEPTFKNQQLSEVQVGEITVEAGVIGDVMDLSVIIPGVTQSQKLWMNALSEEDIDRVVKLILYKGKTSITITQKKDLIESITLLGPKSLSKVNITLEGVTIDNKSYPYDTVGLDVMLKKAFSKRTEGGGTETSANARKLADAISRGESSARIWDATEDWQSSAKQGDLIRTRNNRRETFTRVRQVQYNLKSREANGKFTPFHFDAEGDLVTGKQIDYNEWIKSVSFVNLKTNAEGKFVQLNPYLSFKFETPKSEEKKKEHKEKGKAEVNKKIASIKNDDTVYEKGRTQKVLNDFTSKEQQDEAKRWFDASPLSKVITLEEAYDMVNTDNPNAVATFSRNGIVLWRGSDRTDIYHEAWHGFSTLVLGNKKKKLYDAVRKQSGTFTTHKGKTRSFRVADDLEIEEWLAEGFRQYVLTGGAKEPALSPVKTFFQKIWAILKAFFSDATVAEGLVGEVPMVREMYQKLHTGKFKVASYEETQFNGVFEKGIDLIEPGEGHSEMGAQDSKLIVETVDGLVSEYAEFWNAVKNNLVSDTDNWVDRNVPALEGKRWLQVHTILRTPKLRQQAYEWLLEERLVPQRLRIGQEVNALAEKLHEKEDAQVRHELNLRTRDFELINATIENFGDLNGLGKKGVASYHIVRSRFADRRAILEEMEEDAKNDVVNAGMVTAREGHGHSGNENSMQELAKEGVLELVGSIIEVDREGKPVLNRLGFRKLMKRETVWAVLQKNLLNVNSPREMIEIMENLRGENPFLSQIIDKLGDPTNSTKMQTRFWQTFNKAWIPLNELIMETTRGNSKQNPDGTWDKAATIHNTRFGNAQGSTPKLRRDWNSYFQSISNPYMYPHIKESEKGRFLDIPTFLKDTVDANPFWFWSQLGLNFSNTEGVIKELGSPAGIALRKQIRDKLSEMTKPLEQRAKDDKGKVRVTATEHSEISTGNSAKSVFANEGKNLNWLLEIELKHGNTPWSFSSQNAAGNSQHETSLHSTLSMMVDSLNRANTVAELIAMPHMEYLDPKYNFFVKESAWFNMLFEDDGEGNWVKRYHEKKPVTITLKNLSGARSIEGEDSHGVSSATADSATKILMDLHTILHNGFTEGTRHADKGSTYLYGPSYMNGLEYNTNGNYNSFSDGTTYIGVNNFHSIDPSVPTQGRKMANRMMMGYLTSEMRRISYMLNASSDDVTAKLVVNAKTGETYKQTGARFNTFDDILSKPLRDKLMSLAATPGFDLAEYLMLERKEGMNLPTDQKNVLAAITRDLNKYWTAKTKEYRKMFDRTPFISDSVQKIIVDKTKAGKLSLDTMMNMATEAVVINSWIHNYESTVMFYGDIAIYNHADEGFHKRNAGISSTGELFRIDADYIRYANDVMGRPYASSTWYKGPQEFDGQKITDRQAWGKTLNTSVHQDTKTTSGYLPTYIAALVRSGMSQEKAAEKLGDYSSMKEGDGQGWMAFDAYRLVADSQGDWSVEQEKLYQKIMRKEDVSGFDLSEFFPVRKMQYWGPLRTGGVTAMAFHKFELAPLIPNVIEGTPLEDLHNRMVEQGIDYSLFLSGSKVATLTSDGIVDKFYDDRATLDTAFHPDKKDFRFTPNVIHIPYLKDQLAMSTHFKGKVTFPTQMRKLIVNGLTEFGVPADFMKKASDNERQLAWSKIVVMTDGKVDPAATEQKRRDTSPMYKIQQEYFDNINELTRLHKEKLYNDAGWEFKDGVLVKGSMETMLKLVTDELRNQDLSDHEREFFTTDSSGNILYPADVSPSAEKVEKILSSLVTRRIIKQKAKGEAMVLVANTGYENKEFMKGKLRNASKEELARYGTSDLPFYIPQGNNGKTSAMKVKIALQGDFKKLLKHKDNEGNIIGTIARLNVLLKDATWVEKNRQLITMVGVRIPVQGHNSMEFMEVYEFLPESAGNILIPPAEIVAKAGSDFDIDKMTTLMPSLRNFGGNLMLTQQFDRDKAFELFTKIHDKDIQRNLLRDEEGNIVDNLDRYKGNEAIKNLMEAVFGEWTEEEVNEMLAEEGFTETFEQWYERISKDNAMKSAENRVLQSIKSILELDSNFVSLIAPNDTSIVKPVADELSNLREYDSRANVNNERGKTISPTRVYEIPYNMYKQESNNVGKQVLGMGAVANTFSSIFTQVGFHMEPEYDVMETNPFNGSTKLSFRKTQSINMKHNILSYKGKDAISLSHERDVKGENVISEVIAQLINGWVDVAKDAWVFDVQGNKQLTPAMEFLIEAGVPFRQAVLFVSNPMVREYKKMLETAQSTFGKAFPNQAPENPNWYKNFAKEKMLARYFNIEKPNSPQSVAAVEELRIGKNKLMGEFTETSLEAAVNGNQSDAFNEAVFLEFLHIDGMADSIRDVKMRMNYDTTRTNSFFEAHLRTSQVDELKQNPMIPTYILDKIDEASAISSFKIQDFLVALWGGNRGEGVFTVRTHDAMKEFMLAKVKSKGFRKDVEATFGEGQQDRFISEFANDFMSWVFQNTLRGEFNPEKDTYKGSVVKTGNLQKVPSLKFGVFMKDGVLYYDAATLSADYTKAEYDKGSYAERGLATIPIGAFKTRKEYMRFVFERENLRGTSYSFDTVRDTNAYKEKLEFSMERALRGKPEGLTPEQESHVRRQVYEKMLRDKALMNTHNPWFLFKSPGTSLADQVDRIKQKYPELRAEFDLLDMVVTDTGELQEGSTELPYKNLKLRESKLTSDQIDALYENLQRLMDRDEVIVSDREDNIWIHDVFNTIPFYVFLQSGLSTRGAMSLTRIIPARYFTDIMDAPLTMIENYLDGVTEGKVDDTLLKAYYSDFIAQNKRSSGERQRGKDYLNASSLSDLAKPTKKEVKKETTESEPVSWDNAQFDEINQSSIVVGGVSYPKSNLVKNPDNILVVFNGALQGTTGISKMNESSLSHAILADAAIGLPVFDSFVTGIDAISENNGEMTEEAMAGIDAAIKRIKEKQAQGAKIVFAKRGYGQHMLQQGPAFNPMLFIYLSQQLFDEFGYINPGMTTNESVKREGLNIVQAVQPVSDHMVRERMKECGF